MIRILVIIILFCLSSSVAMAGEADVVRVEVKRSGTVYDFAVTVSHHDEGWKHYADKWVVVAPDGHVLATRTLYHPHVDEQPFRRSLTGVKIDAKIRKVTVRAHDLIHGYGGREVVVDLPD
ncbi:hypothetical protein DGMP_19400 [Desulfomarina profundi]|uniref:Uncharacterized protein n=1 Tax=Desulfomarina profundi TaxID=2772557 RepID=A0A8D5FWJ8_9BACT|nr:hypothetical protein DGMP_19400 [Desulfomarina profundi]